MQDRGPLATRQGTPVPLAETHPRVWCQAPSTKHAGEAMCACACACCVCVLRVRVACCVRVKGGEGRTFFEAAEAPFFEAMVVFAFFEVAWSAFMKGPLPCYHLALKRQTADASLVDLGQHSASCTRCAAAHAHARARDGRGARARARARARAQARARACGLRRPRNCAGEPLQTPARKAALCDSLFRDP